MIDRTTKLRWRRRIRRRKQQVEDVSVQAEEHLEKHLFKRLSHLPNVRRFMASWISLILVLMAGVIYQTRALESTYLVRQPAPGGSYTEGIQGSFTNANPLYAVSNVDSSVSRLVFSSLLKYNQKNQLIGDLADNWQVDSRGVTYTVHLKPKLVWHDGKALTADDVVFTYQTIQNPDAKSSLANSWQNINVSAPDPRTVVFTLPSALSSFPHALTNGIVPKHLLGGIPVSQLRSISFNSTHPIGSGPFKWKGIDVEGQKVETRVQHIGLSANEQFYDGRPKLNGLMINTYRDEKQLLDNFKNKQLDGVAGFTALPEELDNKLDIKTYNIPLSGEVMVFFKNTNEILNDPAVRQALVKATNTGKIINGLGYPVISADQPLLKNQLGYDRTLSQYGQNIDESKKLLDQANWIPAANGIRTKNGKPLTFKMYSQSNSEYAYVTRVLQQQWRAVGVDVQVFLQPDDALQSTISFHNYDALVYGITLGVDPDVFPYWHSSQADIRSANRLNFSEYKSQAADQALEAGRTRADPVVRAVKYRAFLAAWRNDAPAIALYQPRFLYITRGQVFGFDPKVLNVSTDRLNNVENWQINQVKNNK